MRKKLVKSISILLISIVVIYTVIIKSKIVTATESNNDSELVFIQEGLNTNLKDSVKRSTYNNLLATSNTIDTTYNLSKNYKLKVKDQKNVGSCWAFAYTSMVESTLKNNKEYSPMHVEYKTSDMYNREIGSGGNFNAALTYSASGYGPVYEEDLPFESVYDEEKNKEENYYLADRNSVSLDKCNPSAKVKDASYFPQIYKSYAADGTITYKSGNSISITANNKTYTEEEVKAIRTLIKKHIKENGGVIASFYTDIGYTADGEIISEGGYYDNTNKSFFSEGNGLFFSSEPNHAVTIVGWDDTFSKDKFPEGHKPNKDGAYIVLNSYGTSFGDNGYFYVSYDDYAIEQQILGISKIEAIDSNSKDVNYKYQYDELGVNYSLAFSRGTGLLARPLDTMYGANIFTKQDKSHVESLTEVGILLDRAEGIEIYVNPTDDDISKCKLVASYTGENALEAGYHVLKLSSPIDLTGDKFVIKLKYINSEGATVPLECNFKNSEFELDESILKLYENAKANQGESYFSLDDSTYNDLYNYKANEKTTFKDTNVCIKAFTTQGSEKVVVTGVELDKASLSMQVGEQSNLIATVKPTNAMNKNVKWSSSDESVATISEYGVITAIAPGKATITVTTDDGGFSATCNLTVTEKTKKDDDIYDKPSSDSSVNYEDPNNMQQSGSSNNSSKTSSTKLPQTGSKSIGIIVLIGGIILIVLYIKCKKYKDIR